MSELGRVISKHRLSATSSGVLLFLGVLFLGCAGLLAFLMGKAEPEGRPLIERVVILAAVIGGGALLWGLLLRHRGVVTLAENGVRVAMRGGARAIPFHDIAESCQLYRSGVSVGLAFRTEDDPRWASISAHLSGYARFREGFLRGYLAARLPVLEAALADGGVVPFKIATVSGWLEGAFATGIAAYVDAQTSRAVVDAQTLRFGDEVVELARLVRVEHDPLTDHIVLTEADGTTRSLRFSAVLEPELLVALLDRAHAATAPG